MFDSDNKMNFAMLNMVYTQNVQTPAYIAEMQDAKLNHPGRYHFLHVSDSNSEWTPDECKEIINELQPIDTKKLKELGENRWNPDLGEMHKKFIRGLKYCVKNNQKVVIG